MDRRRFLSDVGITVAAACAGCLAACSKSGDDGPSPNPNPNPNPNPGGPVNFNINLATDLQTVGSSKSQSGVIVVRLAEANVPESFTAVQQACTHEGTNIGFNQGQGQFVCPNHGSVFNTNGTVAQGPASRSLKKYIVTIDGNTLNVKE
jgi:cytochrome b6-f complex iron-sulfur subunit